MDVRKGSQFPYTLPFIRTHYLGARYVFFFEQFFKLQQFLL